MPVGISVVSNRSLQYSDEKLDAGAMSTSRMRDLDIYAQINRNDDGGR